MKLEEAYKIFGFRFGDTIERDVVKSRFNLLAKQKHPDAGGSNEDFMKLKEAHHIMMTHSHGPKTTGPDSAKPREVRIKKVRHADIYNSVTHENAEEHRKIDSMDALYGAAIVVGFFVAYYSWLTRNVMRSSDGRSRMLPDEVKPQHEEEMKKPHHSWHPWKTPSELKDQVLELEADRRTRMGLPTSA